MTLSRTRLRELLRVEPPEIELRERLVEPQDGFVLERLRFELSGKGEVRGFLARPPTAGPHPAILYAHAHGGRYDIGADEFLEGQTYLLQPALGPIFARAGFVTLMIDMECFGKRATRTESSATKALNWYGKSLIGEMVSDQAAALGWLAGRDDVDAGRIATFGMSMGCILSYWLAAVDERVAATAHLCCLADFATLIEQGAHDGHGIYLTVPGLLEYISTGAIAGMVAPRPQLVCIGEDDPLTPSPSWQRAFEEARSAYAAIGAEDRLQLLDEPGVRHQETAAMRAETLAFLARWLGKAQV